MIWPIVLIALVLLIGLAITYFVFENTTEKMLDDFTERFPNKCPICSYHRYGVSHGFEKNLKPPKHDCPERKSK